MTARVLIVDDDREMRTSLTELMQAAGWRAEAVARAAEVLPRLADDPPDVIVSDVRMPGLSGLDLLNRLPPEAPPIVLISAHGDIPMAVEAMRRGAYSFVEKPYDPKRLLSILTHAADQHRLRQGTARLKARLGRLAGLDRVLIGTSAAILTLRDQVPDLAQTATPVLILGETGTGKEIVARALHDLGPRADGPFLALNCAALTAEGFEAEMMGTAGGPAGRLRQADGGTLFLDEVAECPLPVQAKLLRLIEDRTIQPLGGGGAEPIDFRLVSATNADPERAVGEGRLRPDLLYRLNTVTLTLPSLRDNRGDLPLLYTHFAEAAARTYEVTAPPLEPEDVAALMAHDWPGNGRELRNVAERRVLMARRGQGSVAQAIGAAQLPEDVPETLRGAVAAFERELIGKAIRAHEGRMDAVAEALGIGRRTLNDKIVKLGLDKGQLV